MSYNHHSNSGGDRMIREAKPDELNEILELYLSLHEDSIPEDNEHLKNTWAQILRQ